MFLGFWEIVLVLIVVIILVLPEFTKSKKARETHKMKLYLIVALLIILIMFMSRCIFVLFSSAIGLVAVIGVLLYFFYRYTQRDKQ